jgi:hypothetical protein
MKARIITGVLPLLAVSMAFGQNIRATVNGERVHFGGVKPITVDGRVLVPVRGIFEKMGVNVDWEPATRSVYANGNGHRVMLYVDSRDAKVDNDTVQLDVPAQLYMGRTMVPLRFISESMGAQVRWLAADNLVAITTGSEIARENRDTSGVREQPIYRPDRPVYHRDQPAYRSISLAANTVIPVRLNEELSSSTSAVGDMFTATLDTTQENAYMGLPYGTVIEGHVNAVRAMGDGQPGVLGLAFDRIKFPDGRTEDLDGSLIGLDSKSVSNRNGRIVAKKSNNSDTKYVGIGAGAGALLAVITKGNVISNAVIGAALGYLYDQSQATHRRDVTLKEGTTFGVVLNRDETFRVQ